MPINPTAPETPSSNLRELDVTQLDHVNGGASSVLVPTAECPTCASGADPTVLEAQYQSVLAGDM